MSMDLMRRFDPTLLAVCGGALSAACTLVSSSFNIVSFFLIYFSALPLYFVGFCWGVSRAFLASSIAFGLITIGGGIYSALVFTLTTLIPALLIVSRVQKGDGAGYVVSWVSGLAIVIFMGIHAFLSSQSVDVLNLLQSWFSHTKQEVALQHLSEQIVPLIPGLSSITWIIMCLVNATIAQRLAMKFQLARRSFPLAHDAELYESWDIVFTLSLLLTLSGMPELVFVGKNIALMSCVPIFLVGLRVIYAWLERFETPKLWIGVIAVMSIFLVQLGIIVVMFGFLEPTLHLRQRWAKD